MVQDFLDLEVISENEISVDGVEQYRGLLSVLESVCTNPEYYAANYVYDGTFKHKTIKLKYNVENILGARADLVIE